MNLFYQCIITLPGGQHESSLNVKSPNKVHYWPIKTAASYTAFTQ